MRYLGGKSKIRKKVASFLESVRKPGQPYLEPFCGGGWVLQEMTGKRIAGDGNDGGYARSTDKDCYAATSKRSLMKQLPMTQDVTFRFGDYREHDPINMLVYCDPPYADTTSYGAFDSFDSDEFWQTVREWSKLNTVVVSEYKAPDDFICVAEFNSRMGLTTDNNRPVRTEKLFIHVSSVDLATVGRISSQNSTVKESQMSNIVAFAGANLPAVSSLATSLRSLEADVGPGGIVIIKMDKTGHWVFGADQTEVEDDSTWAINPFSFVHGYIAWGDGEVLGEKMTGVANPLPETPEAPPGAKRGWEVQVGCSMKCLSGEDEGMEARYTTTSVGGKRAVQELAVAIAGQVEKDQTKPVPVVALGKEHYQHKSFGRIYTPVFKVVEWVSITGDAEAAPEAAPEPEAVAAPEATTDAPRRRRRTAA
jgi:hypothetical protein